MNRWPYRPLTLIKRFERAVLAKARLTDDDDVETWFQASRAVELARRDLLARVEPASRYQAKPARLSEG
jgi:hypothetical protein